MKNKSYLKVIEKMEKEIDHVAAIVTLLRIELARLHRAIRKDTDVQEND